MYRQVSQQVVKVLISCNKDSCDEVGVSINCGLVNYGFQDPQKKSRLDTSGDRCGHETCPPRPIDGGANSSNHVSHRKCAGAPSSLNNIARRTDARIMSSISVSTSSRKMRYFWQSSMAYKSYGPIK